METCDVENFEVVEVVNSNTLTFSAIADLNRQVKSGR